MAAVGDELRGRSFRQFQLSKDGTPRKADILNFSSGLSLWVQYAQDGHAINKGESSGPLVLASKAHHMTR